MVGHETSPVECRDLWRRWLRVRCVRGLQQLWVSRIRRCKIARRSYRWNRGGPRARKARKRRGARLARRRHADTRSPRQHRASNAFTRADSERFTIIEPRTLPCTYTHWIEPQPQPPLSRSLRFVLLALGAGVQGSRMRRPVCCLHGQWRMLRCGKSTCGKLQSTLGGWRPVLGGGYALPTLSSKRCQSRRKT